MYNTHNYHSMVEDCDKNRKLERVNKCDLHKNRTFEGRKGHN